MIYQNILDYQLKKIDWSDLNNSIGAPPVSLKAVVNSYTVNSSCFY